MKICTKKKYNICAVIERDGNSHVYDAGSVCGDSTPSMKDQAVKDLVASFIEKMKVDEENVRVFVVDEKSSTTFIKGER